MSEQRGDAGAEAIAHDADAPARGADRTTPDAPAGDLPPEEPRVTGAHAAVRNEDAGRPSERASGEHAPDDDMAHHSADVDDHDDHAHDGDALGPIDTTAWLAGVVGVALGLAVALCFIR